jgi:hypothetical protein
MRTHQTNVSSLVVGLIFLGLAAAWLLREWDVIPDGGVQWILPVLLVGAGLIGLFAYAARSVWPRSNDDNGDLT